MKLIVGLGNPGPSHAGQRHNIGFIIVDAIAAAHGFGPWRARFKGHAAEGQLNGEKAILLKPATWMNLSGQSVGEAMRYLKIGPPDVIVIHDELDLAPGIVRMKTGGGHAGHNGLRSIHQHIGEDYRRLRVGIGHPGDKNRVTGHVLSRFGADEVPAMAQVVAAIADAAPSLAAGDAGDFGSRMAAARNAG